MSSTAVPGEGPPAKRGFAKLVENPILEDYSLRYAPSTFRRWSEYVVATAALGGIAYLADFAIGASIAITYGFTNALLAVLLAFTFIFFALEGSIMAQAIQTGFGIPLWLGYLLGALVIIPLVCFGMTLLSKLQVWTQPIWLVLMFAPFVAILINDPHQFAAWTNFKGHAKDANVNGISMGLGAGIALSLIAQIGEQVDYLRFMPTKTKATARRWWIAVLAAGPGWVILGALKQLGGAFLAFYVASKVGLTKAGEPIEQYLGGFGNFLPSGIIVGVAVFFVLLSQVKINVTNAYSGSLSWSNFFSRVLHWHPGRVVWVFFNVGIALTLMEVGVFSFLNTVLGFYSNVAIAWIGAVVADLVINKPLKLSPSYIEFKRAHLYAINPVGFGAMTVASVISILAFYNAFGAALQAYSPFLALGIAMVLSPVIAWATKGKYYIAREDALGAGGGPMTELECVVCGEHYELPDMAGCPFHEGSICSLCCTLEKTCHDMCKAPLAGALPMADAPATAPAPA